MLPLRTDLSDWHRGIAQARRRAEQWMEEQKNDRHIHAAEKKARAGCSLAADASARRVIRFHSVQ